MLFTPCTGATHFAFFSVLRRELAEKTLGSDNTASHLKKCSVRQ
jgi:hypothetical protein